MADNLVDTLKGYGAGIAGASKAVVGATEKIVTPVTDALGITKSEPASRLTSQGYARDGSGPLPKMDTNTGEFSKKKF